MPGVVPVAAGVAAGALNAEPVAVAAPDVPVERPVLAVVAGALAAAVVLVVKPPLDVAPVTEPVAPVVAVVPGVALVVVEAPVLVVPLVVVPLVVVPLVEGLSVMVTRPVIGSVETKAFGKLVSMPPDVVPRLSEPGMAGTPLPPIPNGFGPPPPVVGGAGFVAKLLVA